MNDTLEQVTREIAKARRIAAGLNDDTSRRLLRDYVRELEAKAAQRRTDATV